MPGRGSEPNARPRTNGPRRSESSKRLAQSAASRRIPRRQGLARLARGAAAAWSMPLIVSSRSLGSRGRPAASDRIRVGLIGVGVRGKYLIANLPPEAEVVALCDCHAGRIRSALRPEGRFRQPLSEFADTQADRCAVHRDYRTMLDDPDLDAVMIATPDHHHALPAILACQAGLDIYVEKPLALTIAEGRAIVDAAHRHQRIVQVGSQQRTMHVNRVVCEFIRDGGLGRVSEVHVRNFPGPMPVSSVEPQPIPRELDWDLFCGPAPRRAHSDRLWCKDEFRVGRLLWRGWDLWSDYSGHLMTNWGGHSVDMVQFALGQDDSGPVSVQLDDTARTPDITTSWAHKTPPLGTVTDPEQDWLRFFPVRMRYANGTVLRFDPGATRELFIGERGTIAVSRNDYRADPADLLPPPDAAEQARWQGQGHVARPHLQNWLDCLRTRATPNAPVEAGHRTATICHLANLARRLNRSFRWDPATETASDPLVNSARSRPRRSGFELPQDGMR